jgi:allophanate hydrolase subunit 2
MNDHDAATPLVVVEREGIATSLRDGGRTGLAHLGRSRGGAVDREALHLANRLVGNAADAPAFETSGGLVVRAVRAVLVAVTGSQADLEVSGGPPLGWGVATALPAGAVVRIGRLRGGARVYLSVRGGARTHSLAHGVWSADLPDLGDPSSVAAVPRAIDRPVRLWPGPRLDWFEQDAWAVLTSNRFTVGADSDRVGVRLGGHAIRGVGRGELPSEGLVEGAVQVPPDGRPIVMLADHPVTGGYPVIAVVDRADLEVVAQAPPGSTIGFVSAR